LVFDENLNKHLASTADHSLGRIHDLIYSWEGKRVFRIYLVKTSVVDAHPKLPVGLRDGQRVDQLPRVVNLPYEASVEQLLDFFTDEVLSLNGLLSRLLLDRSGVGVDLQMVLNHLPGIPDNCDGCRSNTSTLAWRKAMSVSSYLLSRSPEIRAN
jgi:hypothetical protein